MEVVKEEEGGGGEGGSQPLNNDTSCRVCGDLATGMYFSALVCVPCKTFFLRYAGDRFSFVCKGNKSCDILTTNRTQCKYCRYHKCLKVGMKRKFRPVTVPLSEGQQICVICGDVANGIHFGCITCEGCKKFFRRGLIEHASYTCRNSETCHINPRTRNTCRLCRWNKCLKQGMSRDAIQMGRPSKVKYDRDTEIETAAQKMERCRLMEIAQRDWQHPRMGSTNLSSSLFRDSADTNLLCLGDGSAGRNRFSAAAGIDSKMQDVNEFEAARRELDSDFNVGRGGFYSTTKEGSFTMHSETSRNLQMPLFPVPAYNRDGGGQKKSIKSEFRPFGSKMSRHEERSSYQSIDERLVDVPQESSTMKSNDYFSGTPAIACPRISDARQMEQGIVSTPDSYSSSSPSNAELDEVGEIVRRYQYEIKNNPNYFSRPKNNPATTSSFEMFSQFAATNPERMSLGEADRNAPLTARSVTRRVSEGQVIDHQSNRYIFDMDSPPSSNASDNSLESGVGNNVDGKTRGNPVGGARNISHDDALARLRQRRQTMPSLNRMAAEASGGVGRSFSGRGGRDTGSPGSTRSSDGSSCGGEGCVSKRWGAIRDTGSPYESLIDLTFKCRGIKISNATMGIDEDGGGEEENDCEGDTACYHYEGALVLSDEDLQRQLELSGNYWLYGGRYDDQDDGIFDHRHSAFVNKIVTGYERFVKTGTHINRSLAQELQNSNANRDVSTSSTRRADGSEQPACCPATPSQWIQASVVPVYTLTSITYCKTLPGFSSFDKTDQQILVRLGQSPSRILVAAVHWFRADTQDFVDFLSWRTEDLFKDKLVVIANEILELDLDIYESAVLNALIVIASDYPGLRNPDLIEAARRSIVLSFKAYLTAKLGAPNDRLTQLFRQMFEVRRLGFLHYKMTKTTTLRAEECVGD